MVPLSRLSPLQKWIRTCQTPHLKNWNIHGELSMWVWQQAGASSASITWCLIGNSEDNIISDKPRILINCAHFINIWAYLRQPSRICSMLTFCHSLKLFYSDHKLYINISVLDFGHQHVHVFWLLLDGTSSITLFWYGNRWQTERSRRGTCKLNSIQCCQNNGTQVPAPVLVQVD